MKHLFFALLILMLTCACSDISSPHDDYDAGYDAGQVEPEISLYDCFECCAAKCYEIEEAYNNGRNALAEETTCRLSCVERTNIYCERSDYPIDVEERCAESIWREFISCMFEGCSGGTCDLGFSLCESQEACYGIMRLNISGCPGAFEDPRISQFF